MSGFICCVGVAWHKSAFRERGDRRDGSGIEDGG